MAVWRRLQKLWSPNSNQITKNTNGRVHGDECAAKAASPQTTDRTNRKFTLLCEHVSFIRCFSYSSFSTVSHDRFSPLNLYANFIHHSGEFLRMFRALLALLTLVLLAERISVFQLFSEAERSTRQDTRITYMAWFNCTIDTSFKASRFDPRQSCS